MGGRLTDARHSGPLSAVTTFGLVGERARERRLVACSAYAFVEAQLRRHGFWEAGDTPYVSNTHGQ